VGGKKQRKIGKTPGGASSYKGRATLTGANTKEMLDSQIKKKHAKRVAGGVGAKEKKTKGEKERMCVFKKARKSWLNRSTQLRPCSQAEHRWGEGKRSGWGALGDDKSKKRAVGIEIATLGRGRTKTRFLGPKIPWGLGCTSNAYTHKEKRQVRKILDKQLGGMKKRSKKGPLNCDYIARNRKLQKREG